MGKKSKLFKSGLPRTFIKKNQKKIINYNPAQITDKSTLNNNTLIKKNHNNSMSLSSNSSFDNNNKNLNSKKFLNKTVNYDLDILKKTNESLGLSQKEIENILKYPMRNRRPVYNLKLTRRQKKSLLRKEKEKHMKKIEENTKLNISMNNNLSSILDINKTVVKNKKKKNKFDFDDFNNAFKHIENEEKNIINKNNNYSNKNKKNIINEAEKNINNFLKDNKNFDDIRLKIKQNQQIAEYNKKIKEEYDKNYNFLNIK